LGHSTFVTFASFDENLVAMALSMAVLSVVVFAVAELSSLELPQPAAAQIPAAARIAAVPRRAVFRVNMPEVSRRGRCEGRVPACLITGARTPARMLAKADDGVT
jgi:hypothetical protein